MLRFAYNTNGCANHRLPDAIDLISDAGYDGIALTLDWHHLDPFAPDWERRTDLVREQLDDHRLGCVIETGARYLLDPRQKHEPTLINRTLSGRARRVAFLKRAIDIQVRLGAETVSCWAGVRRDEVPEADAWGYLREGLSEVVEYALRQNGELSLEPEPGMLVETNQQYLQLVDSLGGQGQHLKLALDLGHVWVTGESFPEVTQTNLAPAAAVYGFAERLGTVAIEGMDRGVHLHKPLDEGDMPIAPLLQALTNINYQRLVSVELSRESPRAHEAIPQSITYLNKTVPNSRPER